MTQDKHSQKDKNEKENPISQPDPETLHKTDPQDNMKGPISSAVNNAREKMEENDSEVKEDDE